MTVWSVCPLGYEHELDLLEIRLAEQDPAVDRFIVAESAWTYSGQPKPELLDITDDRWEPWWGKLIQVMVEDEPPATFEPYQRFGVREHWQRENWQRKAITHALIGRVEPDDVVCISDLDEILKPHVFRAYESTGERGIVHPQLPMHRNFLNLHWRDRVALSIARLCRGEHILDPDNPLGVEGVRRAERMTEWMLPYWNAYGNPEYDMSVYGWHFSWMGGSDAVAAKLRLAAHPEELGDHNSTPEAIESLLEWGADIQGQHRALYWIPDDRLPAHAQIDRFAHLRCGPEYATPGGDAGLAANPSYYWKG